MRDANTKELISEALEIAIEMNPQATDGNWLEDLTVQIGPHIKDWDIEQCWPWSEWPEREDYYPKATKQDVGIDAVATRRGDGVCVAIQCKSRQLNAEGQGNSQG